MPLTPLNYTKTGKPVGFVSMAEAPMHSQWAKFYYARRDGDPAGYLYKEYNDSDSTTRALRLMDYLDQHPRLKETLPCLPLAVVSREGGGSGVLMREIPSSEKREVFSSNLATRRSLAIDLCLSVAMLHANGIVHGDLTDRNVLYDLHEVERPRVTVIDMDMASVWESPKWREGLHPIQMPLLGEFRAPELSTLDPDEVLQPSIYSDRWGLAVLLHHLLLGSSPLAILGVSITTYSPTSSPKGPRYTYPPRASEKESERIIRHRQRMAQLPEKVQSYFVKTFDQTVGVGPARRISGSQWLKALRESKGWGNS